MIRLMFAALTAGLLLGAAFTSTTVAGEAPATAKKDCAACCKDGKCCAKCTADKCADCCKPTTAPSHAH